MKIRIVKNKLVDVEKTKLGEVWDKQYNKWDEIDAVNVIDNGNFVDIHTTDGDIILDMPKDCIQLF